MDNLNIELRDWTKNDIPSLLKHANNEKIANMMTNQFPYPYTLESARGFIEVVSKQNPRNIKCISLKSEAIGAIGIHPQGDIHIKNAELGYWLSEDYWSMGIMTKAIPLMLDYSFKNFNIERIFARPFSSNPGSQKVLEKTGFKKEAELERSIYKNGVYLNELIYSIWKAE